MGKDLVDAVDFVVVGAGISGLGFAAFAREEAEKRGRPPPSVVVLERDDAVGGYCKTVKQSGFIWDYSGHFFHFRHKELEAWLLSRMAKDACVVVERQARVWTRGSTTRFPFQRHLYALPPAEFLTCLTDLLEAQRDSATAARAPTSFKDMLRARLGAGICERFLFPYNEKLYAIDLDRLDVDAMGRFFPHAAVADIVTSCLQGVRGQGARVDAGYNATFTYPRGGAIEYVNALQGAVGDAEVALGEPALHIDASARTVTTSKRTLSYRHLITSAPLPLTLKAAGLEVPDGLYSANRVLVFNLGFDQKGPRGVHWMYFPDRDVRFYRVGFYDNIFDADGHSDPRMSLYVEIGLPPASADAALDVDAERDRVLADLRRVGIVTDHTLVAQHHIVMDPAYVHITRASLAATEAARATLRASNIHSVGRYGGWTYCSIEDNLVEVRALAAQLLGEGPSGG